MVKPKNTEEWKNVDDYYCQSCKVRTRVRDGVNDFDDVWYSLEVDIFHSYKAQKYYFCSLDCLYKFIEEKGGKWLPK